MTREELLAQVERERVELAAAPPVPSAGLSQRCHWCGQLIPYESATLVETVHGVDRYRGGCCNGK